MILLRDGDTLPTVAGVQLLLNAQRAPDTELQVDGAFGPRTRGAVRAFQRASPGLAVDGEVGPQTWRRLAVTAHLKVRDWADISDPIVEEMIDVVRAQGSTPIIQGPASLAVGNLSPAISASDVRPGELFLLRFLGHGNRGSQVVGYGTGCHIFYDVLRRTTFPGFERCRHDRATVSEDEDRVIRTAMSRSGLSNESLRYPEVVEAITRLRPLFASYGSVEFHGCQVGGGEAGERFLQSFADLIGVPCAAAQRRQLTAHAIRFSGPIRIACPGGGSLRMWARGLVPLSMSAARTRPGAVGSGALHPGR